MTQLWDRTAYPLRTAPFDHILVDGFLPPDLFAQLASSFPECPPGSGPTGFTIHPGDEALNALMTAHPAWRDLHDACNSQAFVDFTLGQFSAGLADAAVDLRAARHVDYIESRADKERRHIRQVRHAPDELWVRFDLMQGRVGYSRDIHLDHRRRAATMLIYFSDVEGGADGGDLVLHHPDGAEAARVVPKANRMVMFACSNRSFHSVTPVRHQTAHRNCVQVTLSSSVDLWPSSDHSETGRFRFLDKVRGAVSGLRSYRS